MPKKYSFAKGQTSQDKATSAFKPRTKILNWLKEASSGVKTYYRLRFFKEATQNAIGFDDNGGTKPMFKLRCLYMENPFYDEALGDAEGNNKMIYHNDISCIGEIDEAKVGFNALIKRLQQEGDTDRLNIINETLTPKYMKNKDKVTPDNPITWEQMTRERFFLSAIPVEAKLRKEKRGNVSVPTGGEPVLMEVKYSLINQLFGKAGAFTTDEERADALTEEEGLGVDVSFSFSGEKGTIEMRYKAETRASGFSYLGDGPEGETVESYFTEDAGHDMIPNVRQSYRPQEFLKALYWIVELPFEDADDIDSDAEVTKTEAEAVDHRETVSAGMFDVE